MPGLRDVNVIGHGPLDNLFTPDTTQRFELGQRVRAYDPFFGSMELVYGTTAAAMGRGRLVYADFGYVMTDIPNSAATGYPILVANQDFSAAAQFGWFQTEGYCPILTANSVAAGTALGVAAAGKGGTLANGKQINGMVVVKASTYAPTKVCQVGAPAGSTIKRIDVPNIDGLFVGLVPSGTGIAAGTVASIDTSGTFISVSANNTAAGANITVTFTWTGYLMVYMKGAFVQGQVV